jgi:hypothetical protein
MAMVIIETGTRDCFECVRFFETPAFDFFVGVQRAGRVYRPEEPDLLLFFWS